MAELCGKEGVRASSDGGERVGPDAAWRAHIESIGGIDRLGRCSGAAKTGGGGGSRGWWWCRRKRFEDEMRGRSEVRGRRTVRAAVYSFMSPATMTLAPASRSRMEPTKVYETDGQSGHAAMSETDS